MNIGKQRRFSESFRPVLIMASLMWLGINPVFAADEFAVPNDGPAALREPAPAPELVVSEASTAEQIPAALQESSESEAPEAMSEPVAEESPGTNVEPSETPPIPEASTATLAPADNEAPAANEEPVASQTSSSRQATDDSIAPTNVNQEIMTRPDFIDPKVTRNDIHVASIDNENFEFGIFLGMYSTEDFGTSPVYGLKLAYHVNEAVFFEVATGITETKRTSAEDILNVDFISETERELTYYNFSIGYNALPSETYFSDNWAFHSAIYIIGGAGFTDFAGDSFFTMNIGVGYRFLVTDWLALHLDVRDHLFEMDLLGEKKTTQNIELTTGASFFF